MSTEHSAWLSLVAPAAAICGIAAVSAGVSVGLGASVWVIGAATVSIATVVVVLRSQRNMARTRLTNVATGQVSSDGLGVFDSLLETAAELIQATVLRERATAVAKTEIEARALARRRAISRLEAALDHPGVPLVVVDGRDKVTFASRQAITLFSTLEDGLETIAPLYQLVVTTRDRREATQVRTADLELTHQGRLVPFRATARAITDADAMVLGTVVRLEEISEEQRQEEQDAEFVNSLCHELKTPLAGIKAFIEMLQDGDAEDEQQQQEFYGLIDIQVDKLTGLINDMLSLARLRSGVMKLQRVDCEVKDILQKQIDVIVPVAAEKQIDVIGELSELYMAIHVDPDLMGRAVMNLLSNAVKYTEPGGTVRIQSRMEGEAAVIVVTDSGVGIPSEALPRIFDRFYRVQQNDRMAAGTGLGLALVHYLVTDVHNGTIDVESTVGEGSKFTVKIPLGHKSKHRHEFAGAAAKATNST